MTEILAVQIIEELVEALTQIAPKHSSLVIAKAYLRQIAHQPSQEEPVYAVPRWVKRKPCWTCGSDIFFAEVGNGKWIPVHPGSVVSDSIVMDAMSLTFNVATSAATVMWDHNPGVQWFHHKVFCGMEERPEDPILAEVWDQTNGKDQVDEAQALERFVGILEDTE